MISQNILIKWFLQRQLFHNPVPNSNAKKSEEQGGTFVGELTLEKPLSGGSGDGGDVVMNIEAVWL
jgi:hypothetical protein